jgi:hypothetical protein
VVGSVGGMDRWVGGIEGTGVVVGEGRGEREGQGEDKDRSL